MISLNQALLHERKIDSSKDVRAKVKIFEDAVNMDIDKLNSMYDSSNTKINQKNIRVLRNELKDLLKEAADGSIEIKAQLDTAYVSTKPEFRYEGLYGIDYTNYIFLKKGTHLVTAKYPNLCSLMAFEYAYGDYGMTLGDIEELLRGYAVISPCEPDVILKHIKKLLGDSKLDFYSLTKGMRIDKCPYVNYDETVRSVNDYFGVDSYMARKYDKVLAVSCKEASSILMEKVIVSSRARKNVIVPVVIAEDRISYLTTAYPEESYQALADGVALQVVGRKFMVDVDIDVIW